jgi:hypothetical protein
MEEVLPREMICEVMKYLSERELSVYGQVSKTTLESSEMEWKMRYERLFFEKKEDTTVMTEIYWMKNYTTNYKNYFSVIFKEMIHKFELPTTQTRQQKKSIISEMFDFILENQHIVFRMKRFDTLKKAIQKKLNDFLEGDEVECQIADKYYPLLYPEEYPIAVSKRDEMLKEIERNAYEDLEYLLDVPWHE